jgi:hypothetical protein
VYTAASSSRISSSKRATPHTATTAANTSPQPPDPALACQQRALQPRSCTSEQQHARNMATRAPTQPTADDKWHCWYKCTVQPGPLGAQLALKLLPTRQPNRANKDCPQLQHTHADAVSMQYTMTSTIHAVIAYATSVVMINPPHHPLPSAHPMHQNGLETIPAT